MSESRVVHDVLLAIGALPGVLAWRNNTGALRDVTGRTVRYGSPGSPDILAVVAGRFVGLECKTRTGRQPDDQRTWQRACEAAGGIYAVVRSDTDALAVVQPLLRVASRDATVGSCDQPSLPTGTT